MIDEGDAADRARPNNQQGIERCKVHHKLRDGAEQQRIAIRLAPRDQLHGAAARHGRAVFHHRVVPGRWACAREGGEAGAQDSAADEGCDNRRGGVLLPAIMQSIVILISRRAMT